jgi:hypothetical protein
MSPAALSIVLSEFREGKERNTAMGVWAAVSAGGAAAGVLLGGILTQYLSWKWNFFVNVPVGVIVVFGAMRLLPHHIGEENKKLDLDLPGATLATLGLMGLVYGLSKAPNDGWGSLTVQGFIAAGIALLVVFILNESRLAKQPLMPLEIFKIRNVLGANVAFLVIACTLFSMFTLSKTMKVGGDYWHNVFPGLAIFAFGMGNTFVSGTLAATSGVPKHFSGLASGILNTAQQVGGAIGLAVLSAVAFSTVKSDLASRSVAPLQAQVNGYRSGMHVGVGLGIFAAIVVFAVVKNHKVDPSEAMGSAPKGVEQSPAPGL